MVARVSPGIMFAAPPQQLSSGDESRLHPARPHHLATCLVQAVLAGLNSPRSDLQCRNQGVQFTVSPDCG
jgi:hypothetical protein